MIYAALFALIAFIFSARMYLIAKEPLVKAFCRLFMLGWGGIFLTMMALIFVTSQGNG